MHKIILTILCCFTACLAQTGLHAQINIKVGYNLAYMQGPELNQIINDFNSDPSLIDVIQLPMPEFHTISGIEIGGRYTFGNASVELTYDNLNKDQEAVGELDNGGLFQERIFYSQKGLNLSLESSYGFMGWGGGILSRTQTIRGNVASSDNKYEIVSQTDFAAKAFLVFKLGGTDNLSFEVRPFFIYPLGETDISNLVSPDEWNINTTSSGLERFQTFGISFAFYNGPQL